MSEDIVKQTEEVVKESAEVTRPEETTTEAQVADTTTKTAKETETASVADETTSTSSVVATEKNTGTPTSDDITLAVLSHVLGLFFGFVGPLIIWLTSKDKSSFVDTQSKEALNFQISIAIYFAIAGVLTAILIGALAMPVIGLLDLIFVIMASLAAKDGKDYQYPLSIRFIK